MVDRLRVGVHRLVTAFGWYLTKHAAGVYGAEPHPGDAPGRHHRSAGAIDATAVEIATEAAGPAVVVASTVVNGRGARSPPRRLSPALEDGRHIAAAADVSELPCLADANLVVLGSMCAARLCATGSPDNGADGQGPPRPGWRWGPARGETHRTRRIPRSTSGPGSARRPADAKDERKRTCQHRA